MKGSHQEAAGSREALANTLNALGVDTSIAETGDWKMIEQAPPDLEDMGETYERVNDHLDSALKRRPLSIRHVTGEARALVDPAHRRILRKVHERGEQAAIASFFETEEAPTARDFVEQQHRHWGRLKWLDLIDVLELSANRTISISRLPASEDVHFSVFGDALVLLQQPHHHPTHKKWVWYVESRELADRLRGRLDQLFASSVPVDPESFDRLLNWLHEYETFEVLTEIAGTEDLGDEEDDGDTPGEDVLGTGPQPDSIHAGLVALGLAEPERIGLTQLGREWFDQVVGDAGRN
jgi:hypothetical protein